MAFVNTMDKFGDEETLAMIIEKSITEYCDDSVTTIKSYAFYGCMALTKVDCPNISEIQSHAFNNCETLSTLILRGSTAASLGGTSAFTSTPIASGTGYIYVPAALIDSYKAATNWSTYAAQFRALEDYTVDGTVSGDLDETKI